MKKQERKIPTTGMQISFNTGLEFNILTHSQIILALKVDTRIAQ